jgi:DNA repair protein RadA/Sms
MYSCSHCDTQYLKWTGRCNECGKWGTITENAEQAKTLGSKSKASAKAAQVLDLAQATATEAKHIPTDLPECDRVLGGGIVPGSVTLLAGEPGIGKSTLVAQLADTFSKRNHDTSAYYASGEESEGQVRLRFVRLGIEPKRIAFSNTVDVPAIVAAAQKIKPSIVIVDSIQTMMTSEADAFPGTPTAVRAATSELINYAKTSGVPVLIIGQVTKEGSVAGPKTLEHLVDTVLTLEGDPESAYRLLRAAKNRFGSTEEVGVFEMTESGLMTVENPSARFLKERVAGPGSVVTCVMEGSRPFLVEIQALVDKTFFANPVRRTSGYDASRLQMLLAIASKRAGVKVYDQDVFVNVVGGIRITEHAADLAVATAVISALENKPLPADAVVVGELGLGGEVRSVPFLERRLKEAERLGMKTFYTPKEVKSLKDVFK